MIEAYPVDLAAELKVAKLHFAEEMMEDEAISDIIRAKHRQDPTLRQDFPEFWMEPTLFTNDDGLQTVGIIIVHGRTVQSMQETAELQISESLPIATLSQTDDQPVIVTPSFATELQHVGIRPDGSEVSETVRRWQDSWQKLMQTMHGEVDIDPLSDNLELTKILAEHPAYFRTHGFLQTNLRPYDFASLTAEYEWITNAPVPIDLDDYRQFNATYVGLQASRGVHNVRYSLGALDESSGEITRVSGNVGLYAKKGGVPDNSFELFFRAVPHGRIFFD